MIICKQKLLNVCDAKCDGLLMKWGSFSNKSGLRKASYGDYYCIYSKDYVEAVDIDD